MVSHAEVFLLSEGRVLSLRHLAWGVVLFRCLKTIQFTLMSSMFVYEEPVGDPDMNTLRWVFACTMQRVIQSRNGPSDDWKD
jgi:hypothetical protein